MQCMTIVVQQGPNAQLVFFEGNVLTLSSDCLGNRHARRIKTCVAPTRPNHGETFHLLDETLILKSHNQAFIGRSRLETSA